MKLVYYDMEKVATLLRTSATPRRAAHRRRREPMMMGRKELFPQVDLEIKANLKRETF